LSTESTVGIIIGTILFIGLIGLISFWIRKKKLIQSKTKSPSGAKNSLKQNLINKNHNWHHLVSIHRIKQSND
jgi:hypothetical protein